MGSTGSIIQRCYTLPCKKPSPRRLVYDSCLKLSEAQNHFYKRKTLEHAKINFRVDMKIERTLVATIPTIVLNTKSVTSKIDLSIHEGLSMV